MLLLIGKRMNFCLSPVPGVAAIHHSIQSDSTCTRETPSSCVNQPFINFCSKFSTSLLTFEMAHRVYIIFLWLQESCGTFSPAAFMVRYWGVVRDSNITSLQSDVITQIWLANTTCFCRYSWNAVSKFACRMLTNNVHFNLLRQIKLHAIWLIRNTLSFSKQLGE